LPKRFGVIAWYEDNAEGFGRTRIGVILQIPENWASYVAALRAEFGDKVLRYPKPPSENEIHF
jgi:hypothetical protein